ncbi:Cys-Gln thioester bond-forming surface protein [Streptomyces sp. SID8352]|uniref:TQXA domain-containing protein n=1 Tax=Streptomyces sp. SID8352 TaxID=2690338 RepID=UPI0013707CA5|nr:Cys-Gln thioester bond-forming surface protein [Streptomyces sp. SID8352]
MFSSLALLSRPGRGAARAAVAALVSALTAAGVLAGAGPAAAEGVGQERGGATATMGGLKTYGAAVIHGPDGDQRVSAGLFEMAVEGGGTLQTYCVDVQTSVQKDAKYHETPWGGTSLGTNKDAGRIAWILRNSYPQVDDLTELARRAGVPGGLTRQEAAAGTQVAIWRYSDHADVEAVGARAERLADYLEKNARAQAEPGASLTVEPRAVAGRPGEPIGPVTVRTGAGSATVTPPADAAANGVRIVDRKGRPVTSVASGTRVYFDVPEDAPPGTARLTVQASTTVPVGRALASENRSQTQVLAGSSESTVSATATAAWAATGAVPALSAEENCAEGGLDITAVNKGDEPFSFTLLDTEYTIAPGERRTVALPLPEDRAYDFTINGPNGYAQRFAGVLDCRTQAGTAADIRTQTAAGPPLAPVNVPAPSAGPDLASTGGSSLTPVIGVLALTLIALGGATLLVIRRRETHQD